MWIKKMVVAVTLVAASQLASTQILFAMGSDSGSSSLVKAADPNYELGKQAIDAKDWNMAVTQLNKVVEKDPKNADAFNYLGFAHRQMGDYDMAFTEYGKALALNPDHKGANE